MCARFLQPHTANEKHGRLYLWFERGFDAMLNCLQARLDGGAAASVHHADELPADGGGNRGAVHHDPEGLLPAAGHGASSSARPMRRRIRPLRRCTTACSSLRTSSAKTLMWPASACRPARAPSIPATSSSACGPRTKAAPPAPTKSSRACGRSWRRWRASRCHAGRAGHHVGGRLSRTQYQYTLQDSNLDELNTWAPKLLTRLRQFAAAHGRDLGPSRMQHPPRWSPSTASGHPATASAGDGRRERSTTPSGNGRWRSTSLSSTATTWCWKSRPRLQRDPSLFDHLYLTSPINGQQVPLSTFVKLDTSKTGYLAINHQGQVSRR